MKWPCHRCSNPCDSRTWVDAIVVDTSTKHPGCVIVRCPDCGFELDGLQTIDLSGDMRGEKALEILPHIAPEGAKP